MFASRKSAWTCERHHAFLAIMGQERPDFRTIRAVCTPPLEPCEAGLGQVVRLAGEAGLGLWGNGATDGTQSQGKASRPPGLRDGGIQKAVER